MIPAFSTVLPLIGFGAAFCIVLSLLGLIFAQQIYQASRLNRRLAAIRTGRGQAETSEQLRKEQRFRQGRFVTQICERIEDQARRGNIYMPAGHLLGIMLGLSVIVFALLTLGTDFPLVTRLIVTIPAGPSCVLVWLSAKAQKRIRAIEEQLADAIDLMVRSLRVGHPFGAAVSAAAEEIPDPLGTELQLIADEIAYGRDAADAISEFAEKVRLQDLRFLSVAVAIQQKSGGNLAEILDGLSKVVRARFKLFRRVRAITAEAKWSGTFLSGFPVAAMVMILLIKPDYYDNVRETTFFVPLASIVSLLLVCNILYMRRLTDLKV